MLRGKQGKTYKIRDLPGSKTILITLAWGVVTALVPPLAENDGIGSSAAFVFGISLGMVFARTAFFDVLDIQGDRILGRETIPVFMGRGAAIRMLKLVLAAILAALPAGAFGGLIPLWGLALCICPVYLLHTIGAYQKEVILPGVNLEFRVESSIIVAGAAVMLVMICC
jgi:4-hydroxybenzoate polyprenyltransferase